MPPFRPPHERINFLAEKFLQAVEANKFLQLKKPDEAKAIFRILLARNLQQEHAIEEEAEKLLRAHSQQIIEQNADFPMMLKKGKERLAKKKGFIL